MNPSRILPLMTRPGAHSGPQQDTYLKRYDAMADKAAAQVIAQYSTSFSLATNVLPPKQRRDIRNLYAMVRIADEIVDGTATQAHEDPESHLQAYEEQVLHAPYHRFHTDPVLHAYAQTYRRCGFNPEHVKAFFASMRRDLAPTPFSPDELDTYIYGSAEVIGLMSLAVFLRGRDVAPEDRRDMEQGARALGSAFQKINFLRDIGEDTTLGRAYFEEPLLSDASLTQLTTQIHTELDRAAATIPLLPREVRPAVAAAEALFRELTERIEKLPPSKLRTTRVSVPNHRKLVLTARAVRKGGRP